jgi:hypothetical protein
MTNKRIIVMSNDAMNPKTVLILKGEIVADLRITPHSILMGQLQKNEKSTKTLKINVLHPKEKMLERVMLDDERFVVKRKPESTAQEAVYEVEFKGEKKLGPINTKLLVMMKGDDEASAQVPVRLTVVGNLKITKRLYVTKRNGQFLDRKINIESRNGDSLVVKKVIDSEDQFKIQVLDNNTAKVKLLATVRNPEKSYATPLRGTITVQTGDKDQPSLDVSYIIQELVPRASSKTVARPSGTAKSVGKKAAKNRASKSE